ncbi:MAG: hypothetical protein L0H59_07700 [Tomitella sp.]|nr:hypothetical protein [Tomitella sp.]
MAAHGSRNKPFEVTPQQRDRFIRYGYIAGIVFLLAALVIWRFSTGATMICAGIGAGLLVSMYMTSKPYEDDGS